MSSAWYEQRIISALRSLSPGLVQMRLGVMADRDIAIALGVLVREDREMVLRALPAAKGERVRQEQEYMGRVFVSPAHRQQMAERLADALVGKGSSRGGTWIAPPERGPGRR